MQLSLWPVYDLSGGQVRVCSFSLLWKDRFLPLVFLVVILRGTHMTKAVLQEMFWTLLKDMCVFRKKRIHDSCLEENAEPQEEGYQVSRS